MNRVVTLLVVLTGLSLLITCNDLVVDRKQPQARHGYLDLRGWDLGRDGVIHLDGDWEFYWNRLLRPDEINRIDRSAPQYLTLPGFWRNGVSGGKKFPSTGFATLRLRLLTDEQKEKPVLLFFDIISAYRLFINGEEVASVGRVGRTPLEARGAQSPKIVRSFGMRPGVNEVVIQISNFDHRNGGCYESFLLGEAHDIQSLQIRWIALELFLFGSLLIIGLYHIVLFTFRRKDLSPLFFGIFCLLFAIRIFVTGERFIFYIFPDLPWWFTLRLEYLSLYLPIPLFLFFVSSLYPRESQQTINRIIIVLAVFFALSVLVLPSLYFSETIPYFFTYTVLGCLYIIYILIVAVIRKREESGLFLAGFILMFIAAINDIMHNLLIVNTALIAPLGLLAFIFMQAVILSRRSSRAFTLSETLTEQLEFKVRERTRELQNSRDEIEKLNEFSRKVNEVTNLDEVLDLIYDYIARNFHIEGFVLLLRGKEKEEYYSYKIMTPMESGDGMRESDLQIQVPLQSSKGLLFRTEKRKRPVYLRKIDRGRLAPGREKELIDQLDLNSLLLVPLIAGNETIAMVIFSNIDRPMQLSRREITKISRFCEQIAGAVQNSHLLQQTRESRDQLARTQRLLKKDLNIARRIQEKLLPLTPPCFPGVQLYSEYIALAEVGGDFIDYLVDRDGVIGVLVADASGHGVPAALVGSMSKMAMDGLRNHMRSPHELLYGLNDALLGKTSHNFITACYAVYDPATRIYSYSLAGHPPPFLVRPGQPVQSLSGRGSILGIIADPQLQTYTIHLEEGDRVLVVTDGILECRRSTGQELDEFALRSLLAGVSACPVDEMLPRILDDLRLFVGDRGFEDDVTMVLLCAD